MCLSTVFTSSLLFLLLPTPPHPLLKYLTSAIIIIIAYTFVHMCICVYMHVWNLLKHLVLLICMWDDPCTYKVVFGENWFCLSQKLLIACSSVSGEGTLRSSPIRIDTLSGVLFMQILFRLPHCWDFTGRASLMYLNDNILLCILALWVLGSFCLLFYDVDPWALGVGVDKPVQAVYPMINYHFHFDKLYISVTISTAKENVFDGSYSVMGRGEEKVYYF